MPRSARVGDKHKCPAPAYIVLEHEGGPIEPPASPNVLTNGQAQARGTDRLHCARGPSNFIVTGSATVQINGKPAGREGDRTMHQPAGRIIDGSGTVMIGGATVGVDLGPKSKGLAACALAANTRDPNRWPPRRPELQSHGNCGVETVRQIVLIEGNSPLLAQDPQLANEEEFLNDAINAGLADDSPEDDNHRGRTNPHRRQELLARHKIESDVVDEDMDTLIQSAAENRAVITSHEASKLWADPAVGPGGHAILVIGVEYDDEGKPINVIVNDTSLGKCGHKVPFDRFKNSMSNRMVITRKAL